jgi:hypothetical protein
LKRVIHFSKDGGCDALSRIGQGRPNQDGVAVWTEETIRDLLDGVVVADS